MISERNRPKTTELGRVKMANCKKGANAQRVSDTNCIKSSSSIKDAHSKEQNGPTFLEINRIKEVSTPSLDISASLDAGCERINSFVSE